MMKPWLVDVPVRVNIWIRPECQKRQFEVLKEARPSVMFLISDGGRNEKEWEAIYQNRKLFDEEIDWDCTVYKIYEDKNNGLYTMAKKARELIWSKVDRCIFLEDDYIPSVSYFTFCEELLEKYKDDERIQAICGMNHCGRWEDASSDYFFADEGSIWGIATWKRTDSFRDPEHKYGKDPYVMNLLQQHTKKEKVYWNTLKGYAENQNYGNHIAGGEFYHRFEIYAQHRLYIIPKYNMIKNIGCTSDGAHATEYKLLPRGTRQVFDMETYEYEMPLKHPKYVIADLEYSKKRARIMAVGHPFIQKWRRIESVLLFVRYNGITKIFDKLKSSNNKKQKQEN